MNWKRLLRWLILLGGWLLAGCATVSNDQSHADRLQLNQQALQVFSVSGRFAVRAGASSGQASFDWQHSPDHDTLVLYTPLGQTLGVLRRNRDGADLVDGHGHQHHGNTLADLLKVWMGWPLPVDEMSSWVVGAAAPGPHFVWQPPSTTAGGQLQQSGWHVEYQQWQMAAGQWLPQRVAMSATGVQIKLVLSHWDAQP